MNFKDLIFSNKRELKVMARRPPYTSPDLDGSNWTLEEIEIPFESDKWYIEVFP